MTVFLSDEIHRLRALFRKYGVGESDVVISQRTGDLILERLDQLVDGAHDLEGQVTDPLNLPPTAAAIAASIDGVEVGNVYFLDHHRVGDPSNNTRGQR